jgi:hypothetical protein
LTLNFHRQNTDIPIPRVYGYDLDPGNSIGCPFSLLEYIHGSTAEEVSRHYPGDHEGVPAQFEEKFWRQIAKIMIQLGSIRLSRIGSIIRDGSGSFVVGPLVETGSGPYGSAAEFYADYPVALKESFGHEGASGQDELIQAFTSLAASFGRPATPGDDSIQGFALANYDLNPNNVLVDREFNVLAVIDWDTVITAPDAALYRFPFLMGISCAVPGVVDTHPAVLKRQELARRFAEVVESVYSEQGGNGREGSGAGPTSHFTRSAFFSKKALSFRSLVYLKMRQEHVNRTWATGLKWLGEHSDDEVAKFFLGD